MGKETLNNISELYGNENFKNKEYRNKCDFCQKFGRSVFQRDENMIYLMVV